MSSDNTRADTQGSRIRRLLVANRGEIARRVIRSAHDMGIDTVAVFADGDADAPFVREAGRAVALRGSTPAETYLDVAKVLDAARISGADAVHPGYGFLAENAEFARAVEAAGLVWVGPPADAIAAMGDKLAAKSMMIAAGVPTLPQVVLTDGAGGTADVAEVDAMGYPVLVKASAGGGGKGMRIVDSAAELADAVAGAQREAASAFGDGTVFIERYLRGPRHVEIQVLGDRHGNLVHLFERECSIQRRHQKIIEEAPSPALTPALRDRMGAAAVAAAAAVDYHSAGTVEFLVDGEGDDAEFFFLEMNTRIQVEHPVTEKITGVDLVREQLRIAMGEPLGYDQSALGISGHAIEARLYAEDPGNDFLPAIGTLGAFALPAGLGARLDSGVEAGSVVGVEFDPMLAKVTVHAPTRTEAAGRLALVLERMVLAGVTTNRDFLVATLRTDEFLAGDTTTDFIERVDPPRVAEADQAMVRAALVAATMFGQAANRATAGALAFMPSGFRNSSMPAEQQSFTHGDTDYVVRYRPVRGQGFEVTVTADGAATSAASASAAGAGAGDAAAGSGDGAAIAEPTLVSVAGFDAGGSITIDTDGLVERFDLVWGDGRCMVQGPGGAVELVEVDRFPDHSAADVAGGQTAPMPGKVLVVNVAVGDTVTAGQALIVMEAMKMEHTISAPDDGLVVELRCAPGDQVDNGQILVVLEEPPTD